MSVVSVVEQTKDGGRSSSRVRNDDGSTSKRASRLFFVTTDDESDGPEAAELATGVPNLGDALPTDSDRRCRELSVKQLGTDGLHFMVTASYDNTTPEDAAPDNPLDRAPVVSFSFSRSTIQVFRDRDGNPIQNSAGDLFTTPIEKDVSDLVWSIVRNEAGVTTEQIEKYQDALNSDTIHGHAPETLRMLSMRGVEREENGVEFVEMSYAVGVRLDKWSSKILDQGVREKKTNAGGLVLETRAIVDEAGYEVSAPVLLNGSGEVLAEGATPTLLEFDLYKSAAFGPLSLPIPELAP